MFCNKCGTEAAADAKFCSSCGGPLNQATSAQATSSSTAASSVVVSTESSDGFFTKLTRGDYGLAKTYWLYGLVVGVIIHIVFINIALGTNESPWVIAIALLAYSAYAGLAIMGIWRAATKYTGPKIWTVLAKTACVLATINLAGYFFLIVDLMKNA